LWQRVELAFAGAAFEFLERFVEIVGHDFFPWVLNEKIPVQRF
jgi:hypothetical protein